MAYGCQASLEHAVSRLEDLANLLAPLGKEAARTDEATVERKMIAELSCVASYLADAIRYLKDGVP